MEVLAATREGLFVRGDVAVDVADCDLVFCSFETLRDELKWSLKGCGGKSSGACGGTQPKGGFPKNSPL